MEMDYVLWTCVISAIVLSVGFLHEAHRRKQNRRIVLAYALSEVSYNGTIAELQDMANALGVNLIDFESPVVPSRFWRKAEPEAFGVFFGSLFYGDGDQHVYKRVKVRIMRSLIEEMNSDYRKKFEKGFSSKHSESLKEASKVAHSEIDIERRKKLVEDGKKVASY